MVNREFRPSIGRVQNSSKIFNGQKTNATIRDLEEEEGELEEREGSVVSIETDKIHGAGWTVKDTQGETHICSCSTSMYEIPDGKTRGGKLYPSETIKVKFTINPVLRLNSITEILSSGKESTKLNIEDWIHKDESTTVIAKPSSAISISNGFIQMNYKNKNQVVTGEYGVSTEGDTTDINTDMLSINSDTITVYDGEELNTYVDNHALTVSNDFESYNIDTFNDLSIHVDRSNNITQLSINTPHTFNKYGVIGEIKDQKAIPIRIQSQQLVTDGDCMDIISIDEDGIIYIKSYENNCPKERIISSTHNWITPQIEARNYIKIIVNKICNNCDEGVNAQVEYINYCPSCNNWNVLVNTSTSIKCNTCGTQYCQNCGTNLSLPNGEKIKKYHENFISAIGSTCDYCKTQLQPNTNKQYVNYCPDCEKWGTLYQSEKIDVDKEGEEDELSIINILKCESCEAEYCSTCGINQNMHGLTLTNNPVQYQAYKDALRKLKYIKDGV